MELLLHIFGYFGPLKNVPCYIAVSLFPVHLLLAACKPDSVPATHKAPYQLFIEVHLAKYCVARGDPKTHKLGQFFIGVLQAIPLLEMKTDRISIGEVYSLLMLLSLALVRISESSAALFNTNIPSF